MAANGVQEQNAAERLSLRLKDKLLPRMVADGVFGKDQDVVDVQVAPIGGHGEDHWASTTLAVTVKLSDKNDNGKARSLSLVAKCTLDSDTFQGLTDPNVQAANEVNMYTKVFPFFEELADGSGVSISDLYPKAYVAECNVEDMLSMTVMQDLRAEGFRLAKERAFLDSDHALLAMSAIGRLHAFSHAAKALRRAEFLEEVAPLLREPVYTAQWRDRWGSRMGPTMMRGVGRVSERLHDGDANDAGDGDLHRRRMEGLRRLEEVVGDAFPFILAAASPTEPSGVVAHGDFCRNNMQFHYDANGRPERVCFFDFQNSRYCTPVVDLSFFLFLNTSAALRAEHWDELLQAYWTSLQETLAALLDGHSVHEDFVTPTRQGLRDDLRRFSIWGYFICSFFLPQMMVPPEAAPQFEEMRDCSSDSFDLADMMITTGGEEVTEALAAIALDLLDRDLVL